MIKKHNKGFTLIELLVVIAIVGVLSGVVLQSVQSARFKSQNATRLTNIDQIDKAIQLYLTKTNNNFPTAPGWRCLGLNSGNCWGGSAFPSDSNLNAIFTGNLSPVPKDPVINGSEGDYYLYYKGPSASSYGYGAYLSWYVYNIGPNPCGRGWMYSSPSTGAYRRCLLYLGKD